MENVERVCSITRAPGAKSGCAGMTSRTATISIKSALRVNIYSVGRVRRVERSVFSARSGCVGRTLNTDTIPTESVPRVNVYSVGRVRRMERSVFRVKSGYAGTAPIAEHLKRYASVRMMVTRIRSEENQKNGAGGGLTFLIL